MLQVSEINPDTAVFSLTGIIDFDNIMLLNEEACKLFPQYKNITVDLSGITRINSAGLALLLEWNRLALLVGRNLEIMGAPEILLKIAHLCEIDEILSLQTAAVNKV